ncbi:MAG: TonB-dependent receptor [Alphaproteobacteria bacterium]|nr:TonB-dependent receptor [Alphaproteobacteria bacterium]
MFKPVLRGLAVASLFPAIAQAQPVPQAPEVVVTADRIAVPSERVSASVTVITAEQMERRQQRDIVEALRDVPGLTVVRAGHTGAQTSVFVRGSNSNHVLVLIDGQRANDPSQPAGAFDFAHLVTDGIERIEVLRGPASTLYGSDALAGVINIVTKKGKGTPATTLRGEVGSRNTFRESVNTQGSHDKLNFNLTAARLDTDNGTATPNRRRAGRGAEKDPYRNTTLNGRLGVDPNEDVSLSWFFRTVAASGENDSSAEDPNSYIETRQSNNRLQGDWLSFDGAWKQTLAASQIEIGRRGFNGPDQFSTSYTNSKNHGRRRKLEWTHEIDPTDGLRLATGLEGERESFVNRSSSNFGNADNEAGNSTLGAYVSGHMEWAERWFLTLGVRREDNERFGQHSTHNASLAYLVPGTDTKLKALYGTGFKAPALYQLFGVSGNFRGNPDLLPEESESREIGFEQKAFERRLTFGASYFETDFKNLIASVNNTNRNVTRAEAFGVESFASAKATERLTLRLDYSFVETEDKSNGQLQVRRPLHRAAVSGEWEMDDDWLFGAGAIYNGKRADSDADTFGRVYSGGYTVMFATARYRVTPDFDLYGRVENALDRRYEEPSGTQQPGRGVLLGARAKF